MKKSIIAMAVAGALAVPAIASADATLYGSLRVTADKTKDQTTNVGMAEGAFGSRIGIRGTVDLGLEETVGIYQWEAGLQVADTTADLNALTQRNTFIGATGGWGTAVAGRIDHPTSDIHATTEIFDFVNRRSGTSYADTDITNTLAYVSPEINGFQATVGGVFRGQDKTVNDQTASTDGYQLGATYDVADLSLMAAYGRLSTNNAFGAGKQNKWGLGASYDLDALTMAAHYARVSNKSDPDFSVKDKEWGAALSYAINEGLNAGIRYTTAKTNVTGADRRKTTQVEVAQRLGNGAVSAGYIDENRAEGNADTFYVGYRLNF